MFLLSVVVWSVKVIIIRYLHATPRERLPTSSGTNLFVCRLCMSKQALEMALEALLKTQNEGFNLPGSAIREAITAIKEALAQPEDKKCENCGEFGECCLNKN